MDQKANSGSISGKLGLDGLKDAAGSYASSLVNSGFGKVNQSIEGLAGRLTGFAEGKPSGPSIKNKARIEGAKAKLRGKNPTLAAVGGALAGVKDKVKGTASSGVETLNRLRQRPERASAGNRQQRRPGRPKYAGPGRLRPVERIRAMVGLHEESPDRSARRGRGKGRRLGPVVAIPTTARGKRRSTRWLRMNGSSGNRRVGRGSSTAR